MAKGVSGTGEGFDAPAAGKAGGRFVGRDLPAHRLRELALQAAEARAKTAKLMPAGPRTAGGTGELDAGCGAGLATAVAPSRAVEDLLHPNCPTCGPPPPSCQAETCLCATCHRGRPPLPPQSAGGCGHAAAPAQEGHMHLYLSVARSGCLLQRCRNLPASRRPDAGCATTSGAQPRRLGRRRPRGTMWTRHCKPS